jgi:hypothetical protein
MPVSVRLSRWPTEAWGDLATLAKNEDIWHPSAPFADYRHIACLLRPTACLLRCLPATPRPGWSRRCRNSLKTAVPLLRCNKISHTTHPTPSPYHTT